MFRSRTAWLNSRPGTRWRSGAMPVYSGLSGFKFDGGYFMAASGGPSVISFDYSPDLINWTETNLLGSVEPPIIDMACDGTYLYYLYKTSPSATTNRLVRRLISTGASNDLALSVFAKTLNVRTGGTVFYTYEGGFGYISSWPTAVNAPMVSIINPIGFIDIPGQVNGCLVLGPTSFSTLIGYAGSTSATAMNKNGFSTTVLGSAEDRIVLPPVITYNRPAATYYPFIQLYKYKYAGDVITMISGAYNHPTVPLMLGNTLSPLVNNFPADATPTSLAMNSFTGEIYVTTDTGNILVTKDFGASYQTHMSDMPKLFNIISSAKGLVISQTDGSLLISP